MAKTVHNTIEACSHLVTRIPDIGIGFVSQITKSSFRCETVVKDFSTNTGNIFCYTIDFLSNSTSCIRDIFVDTCLCFLNCRFYFLNVSFSVIDFVLYGNCSSTKGHHLLMLHQLHPNQSPSLSFYYNIIITNNGLCRLPLQCLLLILIP